MVGRDTYGVFPLRGKLLNVRDQSAKRVMENEELKHLRMILGLTPGKEYRTEQERAELRYGKVMLMTDQDHDGTTLAIYCFFICSSIVLFIIFICFYHVFIYFNRVAHQRSICELHDSVLAFAIRAERIPRTVHYSYRQSLPWK